MYRSWIKICCALLSVICLCATLSACATPFHPSFTETGYSVFVKTKTYEGTDVFYYELDGNGGFRTCDRFKPNVGEQYYTDCFLLEDNSIEKAFQDMGDRFYNAKHEKVAIPETVRKAMYALDDFEGRKEHWIAVESIFVLEDRYFISISYNVNWQVPYSLLEYDVKKDTLKEILYISNQEIIGIKI